MKTLVVMCNGPSLKEVDFDSLSGCDTFGMNGAYRYYYKNDWWPTYFGCFDYVVTDCHTESWRKMIEDESISIEKYFLLRNISNSNKLTTLKITGGLYTFTGDLKSFGNGGNTGANCCQVGMALGYSKIILLGADCNYVEVVEGAKSYFDGKIDRLEMKNTPDKNPNYFFDDYQQKGDKYNFPQSGKFHEPAWNALSQFAKKKGVDIVNCSMQSKLSCFRKSELSKEI